MIAGIGTDLCDVRRIEAAVSRLGERFAHRILGEAEQQVYAERRQAHASAPVGIWPAALPPRKRLPRPLAWGCVTP